MKQNVIHVGIDVDDNSFHVKAFLQESGEVVEYRSKPNLKGLQNKLQEIKERFPGSEIKVCYEAT